MEVTINITNSLNNFSIHSYAEVGFLLFQTLTLFCCIYETAVFTGKKLAHLGWL